MHIQAKLATRYKKTLQLKTTNNKTPRSKTRKAKTLSIIKVTIDVENLCPSPPLQLS
jgi:hypothetical protein